MPTFSAHTIREYIDEIRAIHAMLQVETIHHSLDHLSEISPFVVYNQYERSKVNYAMMIIGEWLEDTDFQVQYEYFQKKKETAQWPKMLAIIEKQIHALEDSPSIIEITLSKNGTVSRSISEQTFTYAFAGKIKPEIIEILAEHDAYMDTKILQKRVRSKSPGALAKNIGTINSALRGALHIPDQQNQRFIEGKRGQGYRINPLYNVVITK